MERDRFYDWYKISRSNFNSHAHVERDTLLTCDQYRKYNFNSHAHVERDASVAGVAPPRSISTHTLTWSVTGASVDSFKNGIISTHTLTWSVT